MKLKSLTEYSIFLSILFLAACSFQKEPNRINTETPQVSQNATKDLFCPSELVDSPLSRASLLALSSSDLKNDLCLAWNQVRNFREIDLDDSNVEIFDNLTLSINKYIASNSAKNFSNLTAFSRELTNVSIILNGSALKNVITINNQTGNHNHNLLLLPFLSKNISLLFTSTHSLSSNEFLQYWSSIESYYSKQVICNPEQINLILRNKTISSHLLTIAGSCKITMSANQVISNRIHLDEKVTENEVRYFKNSIRSKILEIDQNNPINLTSVTAIAISRNDPNLFRLSTSLPSNRSFIYALTIGIATQSPVEPFVNQLVQSDFEEALKWNNIKDAIESKYFADVLDILYKRSILPTASGRIEILNGIKDSRTLVEVQYKSQQIATLLKYLKSSRPKFANDIATVGLIENELKLIFYGVVSDALVIESIIDDDFTNKDVALVTHLDLSIFEFNLEHQKNSYRIPGEVFLAIGGKQNIASLKSKRLIYFVNEEGRFGFDVKTSDFLLGTNSNDFSSVNLNCEASEECERLKKIYNLGTKVLLRNIWEIYKSIPPK